MRRLKLYIAVGILVSLSLGVALVRPYAFQKLNTIEPASGFEPIHVPEIPVPIADIIGRAPFRTLPVRTVDPARKYRLAIEEGMGNCSERAFGLAWKLRQSRVDYQIVHLLPQEDFVRGRGHSVIRIPYEDHGRTRIGLVDLLEGGIPTSDGKPLDIEDLTDGPVRNFRIQALSPLQDDESEFYGAPLSDVVVGYISARDIDRYFDFIERIYIPLGSDRMEKLIYDGLAMIMGVLPAIRVPEYEILVRGHRIEMAIQRAALWVQRSAVLVIPGLIVFEVGSRVRKRRVFRTDRTSLR